MENKSILLFEEVIANARDPETAEDLHRIAHHGRIEYVQLGPEDNGRRRLRIVTDAGTDCGIALQPGSTLEDGAVLLLEQDRAIVVRAGGEEILRLRPSSSEAALKLGWSAGNLHWKVRFDDGDLLVVIVGRREDYIARLADLIADGSVGAIDAFVAR